MNIVYVHGYVFNIKTWSRACDRLEADGITLHLFSQQQSAEDILAYFEQGPVDIFIGHLFHDLPLHEKLLEIADKAACRIGLGMDMPPGFSSFTAEQTLQFETYMKGVSVDNYVNGIKFLAACSGLEIDYEKPEPVETSGIYHPDAPSFYDTVEDYRDWRDKQIGDGQGRPIVGILCYYGQIMEKNCAEVDAVIHALERYAFIPLCVFCEGVADSTLPLDKRYPWIDLFKSVGDDFAFVLNLMAGRLLSRAEDTPVLESLNVPIIQLIRLYHQTPEDWDADPGGLGPGSHSMVYSLAQPEMSGAIEPTLVAASVSETDARSGLNYRRYVPMTERIDHLCRRLTRWHRLKAMPVAQRQLTIVLNNNPCKGVEATLGLAAGLDTFESLVAFMSALKAEGYDVRDIPDDGEALLNMFLERKAISEFRWTTVDEIVKKGGVLHRTTQGEYETFLENLPARARTRIIDDWGPFPGEGMVYQEDGESTLLVTGLTFGNIKIIVQPKRGCYGAKCNGEVCRILHDPELSPPPHWLATYQYIRETSDAVVHFGTHGALEFLPGKRAALSSACFPEVTLGDLPNVYLYVMDVPGDGLVAKRRASAEMVTHLTPVQRPAVLDDEMTELENLLGQYRKAVENGEKQRQVVVSETMLPLMKKLGFADETDDGENFAEKSELLSRQIARCKRTLAPQGMHLLGTAPDSEGIATMLATILIKPTEERPSLDEIAGWGDGQGQAESFDEARDVIQSLLDPEASTKTIHADEKMVADLGTWCRDVGGRIAMSTREIPQLLRALDGQFIEPGLSGSLALGKTQTLPTGRNFFTSDVLAMPTRAAWKVGRQLADNLLRKYLAEEGTFPESVGVSLWSIDAFKSDGEVFCQILYLMGMAPRWGANGRIVRVEPIELDDLTIDLDDGRAIPRPRVDVVIQTSSILRDMVPHFADLLDEAAYTAGRLDEPFERNAILKHTRERMDELLKDVGSDLSDAEIRRMASFRVFSSAPGTAGTGVGLAIDASAWETDDDLAETYINWAGYAYGSDHGGKRSRVAGMQAHQIYADNLKRLDVSYMRQYSPEYDLVDCGCYTGFLGGMSVAAKAVSGKRAKLYWADTNAQGDLSVRDLKDDIATSVRAKLFNKNWIGNQKNHGYKGAGGVSSRVNNLFKWSATTHQVEKWVFDEVVQTYLRDKENLEWLRQNNPYALEEITRRLMEAESRGLWAADEDFLADVQEIALMIEGDMEETMGEVTEEFQGAKVDVMTDKDVEKWQPKWKIDSARA